MVQKAESFNELPALYQRMSDYIQFQGRYLHNKTYNSLDVLTQRY